MKFHLILDPDAEESVTVVANKRSELTDALEQLVQRSSTELIGYDNNGQGIRLMPEEIYCIFTQDDRVYALLQTETVQIHQRLYQAEEILPRNFVRINRSVLANLNKIKRFDVSFTGTMKVIFQNGYEDYVSRRNLKYVKERLGL